MKTLHRLIVCAFVAALPGLAAADEYFVSGENVAGPSIVTYGTTSQYYAGPGPQSGVTVVYQTPAPVYYVHQRTRYYPFGGHPQARYHQPQFQIIWSTGGGHHHHGDHRHGHHHHHHGHRR